MTHSGGKPHHVGDKGQIFEITYCDHDGQRKVLGWSNDHDGVEQLMRVVECHPVWHSPLWRDRRITAACPFLCNSADVDTISMSASLRGDGFIVECSTCGACGPFASTEEEACRLWNGRSTPAAAEKR